MTTEHSCHYCGPTKEELRPYGPEGAPVCHPCAFATPEREAEVERQFNKRFYAIADDPDAFAIVLGSEDGPQAVRRT